MSWARFDDGILDHPKLTMVSDLAAHLWWKCIVWSRKQRTNGVVPRHVITTLVRVKKPETLAKELVDAIPPGFTVGLFEVFEGGWLIHDFADYGPPQREDVSAARAEAGRRGAAKRWQTDGKRIAADGKAMATCHAGPMANDGSRVDARARPDPDPVPIPIPVLAEASTQAASEPAGGLGQRPTFGKAPHGGKTRDEKARDVAECMVYLTSRLSTLGVLDARDMEAWLVETLPDVPLPADVSPLPILRLAYAAVRDSASATPTMRAETKLSRLRAQLQMKAADDKADGWVCSRSDGREGRWAPKARALAGAGTGGDDFITHELGEMERTERETAKRRGEASAADLFAPMTRKGAA